MGFVCYYLVTEYSGCLNVKENDLQNRSQSFPLNVQHREDSEFHCIIDHEVQGAIPFNMAGMELGPAMNGMELLVH